MRWNFFSSPIGKVFYRYARRRKFLESFSKKQLFANGNQVDEEWLDTLEKGGSFLFLFGMLEFSWRNRKVGLLSKSKGLISTLDF